MQSPTVNVKESQFPVFLYEEFVNALLCINWLTLNSIPATRGLSLHVHTPDSHAREELQEVQTRKAACPSESFWPCTSGLSHAQPRIASWFPLFLTPCLCSSQEGTSFLDTSASPSRKEGYGIYLTGLLWGFSYNINRNPAAEFKC